MIPEANASLSHRIDGDTLSLLPRDTIAADTLLLLDALRNHKGERLVAATAVLFATVAERFDRSPQDLYLMGQKMLGTSEPFHDKGNQRMETLRDYATLKVNRVPAI